MPTKKKTTAKPKSVKKKTDPAPEQEPVTVSMGNVELKTKTHVPGWNDSTSVAKPSIDWSKVPRQSRPSGMRKAK